MAETCPYHSTLANGMRLYGPKHPCFTVYDAPPTPSTPESAKKWETTPCPD